MSVVPVHFLICAPIARYQVGQDVKKCQNTDKICKINSFELCPNVHPPQEA